ncbi:hypothetical protein SF12_12420 [Streptomyces sp. MBRL 601]|nr:hypothetical protein SF12_12420 [Streptomyces sp. MBRL 601]
MKYQTADWPPPSFQARRSAPSTVVGSTSASAATSAARRRTSPSAVAWSACQVAFSARRALLSLLMPGRVGDATDNAAGCRGEL